MSIVNTYMLKRFHRRPLIMVSGLGMCMCMLFSGFFTKWILEGNLPVFSKNYTLYIMLSPSGTSELTSAPTILLLLYVITSMIGLLPIPWTMTAELFPIEIRGVAHSIAYSVNNFILFASVQMFYPLEDWFGGIVGIQW